MRFSIMQWSVVLAFFFNVRVALAWGAAGHEIVATIAQIFLTPATRHALCDILPAYAKCHLAPVASWADNVRNPYTGPLHYINGVGDWPADHCTFGGNGWTDAQRNVLVGIYNSTRNVVYLDGQEQDFALRYLVHFMGDLHMPLHLTGRDKGGNGDAVRFDNRITNLHSVWDGRLIANAIRTLTNYTQPLPSKQIESALRGTIYDSYVRFIVWEGILGWWKEEYLDWPACQPDSGGILRTLDFSLDNVPEQAEGIWSALFRPRGNQHTLLGLLAPRRPSRPPPPPLSSLPVCPHEWAVPIHALNCESSLIWPRFLSDIPEGTPTPPHTPARELIELDTPEYAGRIRKELVIEKLLATAGVRLAAVLNELFDSETSFFGVE